ncbi:MAG: hypothetical protein AAF441_21200 [Pseudomonadota bacterium]
MVSIAARTRAGAAIGCLIAGFTFLGIGGTAGLLASELKDGNAVQMIAAEHSQGRSGLAKKTRAVDARAAEVGEIVVTLIAGEGTETTSPPARKGDMVVRNRCAATGNEEILVTAKKFAARYEGPLGAGSLPGWKTYRPRGKVMRYMVVPESAGSFRFKAPWGAFMKAHPGDALVQDPKDETDTYRIAAAAFACTYEVVAPAKP